MWRCYIVTTNKQTARRPEFPRWFRGASGRCWPLHWHVCGPWPGPAGVLSVRGHGAGAVLGGPLLLRHRQRTSPLSLPGVTLCTYTHTRGKKNNSHTHIHANTFFFVDPWIRVKRTQTWRYTQRTHIQALVLCPLIKVHTLWVLSHCHSLADRRTSQQDVLQANEQLAHRSTGSCELGWVANCFCHVSVRPEICLRRHFFILIRDTSPLRRQGIGTPIQGCLLLTWW